MYLSKWMKKWFAGVLICIFLLVGCGTYQYINSLEHKRDPDPIYVINQVRLKVSDMLLYIEQHHPTLENDSTVRNNLQMMSVEQDVGVLFTQLDGKVSFNSSKDKSVQSINSKNDLHYDLYTARVEENLFKIAFPVVDEITQTQIGNAIFILDKDHVLPATIPSSTNFLFMMSMISFFIILLSLICMIVRKINRGAIRPIQKLKAYSEAILKGNYELKTEYSKNDEIGEVYATFDQMRLEIKMLSIQRDEQEKAQKGLITTISHDIKTPLTTIKAYLDAIREGVCPNMESVMEYVDVMQTNTEKMARLVEDLLVHSLNELGHISVYPKERYSKEILATIIQPISHYVRTTGVDFIEPSDIPDVLINVDEHRLEQVISNLITNSLKHTDAGESIRVVIKQEDNQLKITIADTGKGILPKDMPFIFERYFRGKMGAEKSAIKNEGTGLGLSICKHIMEAHNGSISFKSKKSEGTEFTLVLPLS